MTSLLTQPGDLTFPYVLIFVLGALLLPVLPPAWRSGGSVVVPATALLLWLTKGLAAEIRIPYATYELTLQRVDQLAVPFALVLTLTLLLGNIYAYHVQSTAEKSASLLYGAAALGVVLAGDWLTFYIAWETAAWTSLYLIWNARTEASGGAGQRYVMVHLFGGSMLLAGIWLQIQQSGLTITALEPGNLSSWLILTGMAVNVAVPPLHAWLPDAYPRATVTGSVLLSALTTKTTVYALARVFPGWEILMWAGIVMALYGVTFAVLENNIRRLLSYHIISQVGYMVAGVGLGTALSLNGAAAHAFANMLEKALLFMGAGVVIYAVGRERLSELGGLAGKLRWGFILFMVGAVSISGFPLFGAFVSKSMVISAYATGSYPHLALLLHLAAVGTFLSIGLKLAYFTWFGTARTDYDNIRPVPANMYVAMAATGLILLIIGSSPQAFYQLLPHNAAYQPYTSAHLSETVQTLLFSIFPFVLLLRSTTAKALLTLDTDWLYRKLVPWLRRYVVTPVAHVFAKADQALEQFISRLVHFAENPVMFNKSADTLVGMGAVLAAFLLLALWALLGWSA